MAQLRGWATQMSLPYWYRARQRECCETPAAPKGEGLLFQYRATARDLRRHFAAAQKT
jgi:hypothetical protein